MIVVQHIETTWYKNERGAMHGTLRGKTPKAVALPLGSLTATDGETVLHTVRYARTKTEVQEQVQIRAGKNLHIASLHIESSDSIATINFTWNRRSGGKAILWQAERMTWTLNKNEWCRVRYNSRSVLEDTWLYKITTVNVGVFDNADRNCFETTKPNYSFEDMIQFR